MIRVFYDIGMYGGFLSMAWVDANAEQIDDTSDNYKKIQEALDNLGIYESSESFAELPDEFDEESFLENMKLKGFIFEKDTEFSNELNEECWDS